MLGIDLFLVDVHRVRERQGDRVLGNLVKQDPPQLGPLPTCSATCQAIASPSRSGSVAIKTRSAPLAAFLISDRVFVLPLMVTYLGRKPFSTSTPSSRFGRSRTWPTVAFTV